MSWGDRRSPLPALRPRTTPTAWPLAPARAVRGHRRRADRGDLPGPGRHAGDPQCARLRGSRDLGGRSLELPDRLRRPAATSGVVTPGRGGPARRGGMVPGRRSAPVPIVGNRRGCLWWRGRRVDQRSAQMLAMGRSNSRRPRVCRLGLVGRTAPARKRTSRRSRTPASSGVRPRILLVRRLGSTPLSNPRHFAPANARTRSVLRDGVRHQVAGK